MNIAILHSSLNSGGGSERLCLDTIVALKERGHHVALGTFEKPDWESIENWFGTILKPDVEIVKPRIFGKTAYGETLSFRLLSSKMPGNRDSTIISCTSPWFYCPASGKTIIYMIPPLGYDKGLRNLYLKPYILVQKRRINRTKEGILLTNSSFSADTIEKLYSFKPSVLYPPVDLSNLNPAQKEDLIVSTGRLNPFKRFETLIDSLAKVKNGRCVIMGNIDRNSTNMSVAYLEKLENTISKLGLKARIELQVNCPFHLFRDILSKAKLYVHCAIGEHFGISIVEGMSAGCVPIVHRSGGAYSDIIDHNRYGFSFADAEELAISIGSLLKDNDLREQYAKKAIERSKFFSKENFRKRIVEIIESQSAH